MEGDLLHILNQLAAVLEYRKGRLAETGCPNLDAYNKATGEGLPRLIFACDEVAEVLDRTGRSKEDKERAGADRKQAVYHSEAGAGLWDSPDSFHPEAGRRCDSGSDQKQSGFPGVRQGGQCAFSNHPGQHQRRRTDTQGRKGPLHHRRRDSVPGLSV